jgi:thiol-disulfide isomerase/thioredoxin
MTATAAPAARSANWAVVLGLLAAGLLAMAALQMRRPAPGADLIELVGRQRAKLAPFFDATGKPVSIESFRGRTVILNLWAPWCVPCLQEMPALDRLAARLPAKDFAVVAVAKDPVGPSPSKKMFERMGLSRVGLFLDPDGKLAREAGARGYPTTLIVGADGAPLAYREGAADWDSEAMVAKVDRLARRSSGAE